MPNEEDDNAAFLAAVNTNSIKLIKESLKLADYDPLVSVASMVMAAGRAAAMSGLQLGIQLNLFASQYDLMLQSLQKSREEKIEETLVEATPDPGKKTVN